MEIAFPFTIYKDAEADMQSSNNKPLIHLNTLAQICFRAFSQEPDFPQPELVILDHRTVEGVSQPGRFEIDFHHNYLKKVGEIDPDLAKEKRFRLGLLYKEEPAEQLIKNYGNAILLHGELASVLEKKQLNFKETTIQWITA